MVRIPVNQIDLNLNEDSTGEVVVNGFDLSHVIGANIVLQSQVGEGQEVVLTVSIPGAIVAHAEGQVALDEETTEALKALGWTPPTGD